MNLNSVTQKRVVKRDGRVVAFDDTKIQQAILKAFLDVDGRVTRYAMEFAKDVA